MSSAKRPSGLNKPGSPERTYKRAIQVIEAGMGGELVAMDVERGDCFGFNAVAAFVWRELEKPKSFGQLRDALLGEFDVSGEQCSTELGELLDDLVAKGLVRAEKS